MMKDDMSDSELVMRLIFALETRISKMADNVLFDNDFFRISCGILRIIYRNLDPAGMPDICCIDAIDENIEICRKTFFAKIYGGEKNSFAIANQLPLFIVNMIVNGSAGALVGKDFAPMIRHNKSDVRACTFHTLWFVRDRLDNPGIIQGLLYNLAENLGFVSEAAGLLRGIVGDDERFYLAASKYEPATKWKDQFEYRINQIKEENLLPACVQLLIDFENQIAEMETHPPL